MVNLPNFDIFENDTVTFQIKLRELKIKQIYN